MTGMNRLPEPKPPVGLVPRDIRRRQRLTEIDSAVARYVMALKPIPPAWLDERNELLAPMWAEINAELLRGSRRPEWNSDGVCDYCGGNAPRLSTQDVSDIRARRAHGSSQGMLSLVEQILRDHANDGHAAHCGWAAPEPRSGDQQEGCSTRPHSLAGECVTADAGLVRGACSCPDGECHDAGGPGCYFGTMPQWRSRPAGGAS